MQFHRVVCLFVLATLTSFAGESAAAPKRTITLEECVQLAIERNFDIQIARYTPQIDLFNLRAAYGAYDPTFSARAGHGESTGLTRFDYDLGIAIPASETEYDAISGGLSGVLPTGTSYRLSAGLTDGYGTTYRRIEGTTSILPFPFENTEGQMGAVELRQKLLKDFWIDGARYQIAVQKNALKGSEWSLRGTIISAIARVEISYYDLISSFDQVRVQEKAVELAEKLLAENKKRVEVGAMAPLDEKQAESQLATSRANLLVAQRNLAVAQNMLKREITDEYSSWHKLELQPADKLMAVPVPLDVQESWTRGLTLRPDIQLARIVVDNADLSLKLAKNQIYPSFDIVGALTYNASAREFSDALSQWGQREAPSPSVGFEFSLPLGNQRARNDRKAASVQKEQRGLQLKQTEQRAMVEIDDAITLVRSSLAATHATREARVFAEAALDAEVKKLENGKSTSFEVLRLQRDLTDARSSEIRALAVYNDALAALALAEGTTLERHKLDFTVR